MTDLMAPPLPEGLSQRELMILGRFLTRLRHIQSSSRLRVWDECRASVGVFVNLNVFYIVTIDPERRTRTIEYIRHRAGRPEVGMVGDPYGPYGLCPRLVDDPQPYLLSQDGGAVFRAGYPYHDEFDARDAVAVQIYRPDGSLYGAVVASSLKDQQFTPEVIKCIRWIGQVGFLFRHRDMDAVMQHVWYPELIQRDLSTWVHGVLEETVSLANSVRDLLATGDVAQAQNDITDLLRGLYVAQSQLNAAHPKQADMLERLKPREVDVMRALATDGSLTNGQIAQLLDMSLANVKKVLSSAMAKTGAQNRQDLHRLGVKWRL